MIIKTKYDIGEEVYLAVQDLESSDNPIYFYKDIIEYISIEKDKSIKYYLSDCNEYEEVDLHATIEDALEVIKSICTDETKKE